MTEYAQILSEFKKMNPQRYAKINQTKQGLFKNLIKNAFNNSVKLSGGETFKRQETIAVAEHKTVIKKAFHPFLKFKCPNQ